MLKRLFPNTTNKLSVWFNLQIYLLYCNASPIGSAIFINTIFVFLLD